MCPFARNTRYNGLIHDDLYRPETFQKLEKNPLMVMSEQSERAEIFALLRDCVKNVYGFFNRPENQKLMKKLYCERAEICGIFGSETYTILLNILLINHMVCRYNKLCPCVRNTRDMVLFMMIYSDQKNRNSRETHKWSRASGASEQKFWHFCVGNMWFFSISQ